MSEEETTKQKAIRIAKEQEEACMNYTDKQTAAYIRARLEAEL